MSYSYRKEHIALNMIPRITLIILIIIASNFAYSCSVHNFIEDGSIKITPDKDKNSGMYHVRVPYKYNGNKIELLILSASMKSGDEKNNISVPLSIKSKDGVTGSYFYMSSQWANIRISANYEHSPCTELVANYE